jgi:hypothetical protein
MFNIMHYIILVCPLVNIIDMNEKLTFLETDFLLLDASLLVVGHDLLLCPRTWQIPNCILAPNFLIRCGFFSSLLSSGALLLCLFGLPGAILPLGGSNLL